MHFHRPSEHLINGKNFPMEAHFVHRADNGALAVLGVLIAGEGSNEAFSKIVATMPAHEGPAVKADPSINPKALLPSKLGYYRYEGSLTTPPCSEIVDWLVLADHVTVASDDIVAFAKLYPNNARPAQKRQPPLRAALELSAAPSHATVMPGLDPGIHGFEAMQCLRAMDGRVKPGHDDLQ